MLGGVGRADQCIAVLRPLTETTKAASADAQQNDSALIGHWAFDEGNGSHAVSAPPGKAAIVLDGVRWEAGRWGDSLAFKGEAEARFDANLPLDFDTTDLTFAAWVSTENDGTIFAEALEASEWVPNGQNLFYPGWAFDV